MEKYVFIVTRMSCDYGRSRDLYKNTKWKIERKSGEKTRKLYKRLEVWEVYTYLHAIRKQGKTNSTLDVNLAVPLVHSTAEKPICPNEL